MNLFEKSIDIIIILRRLRFWKDWEEPIAYIRYEISYSVVTLPFQENLVTIRLLLILGMLEQPARNLAKSLVEDEFRIRTVYH